MSEIDLPATLDAYALTGVFQGLTPTGAVPLLSLAGVLDLGAVARTSAVRLAERQTGQLALLWRGQFIRVGSPVPGVILFDTEDDALTALLQAHVANCAQALREDERWEDPEAGLDRGGQGTVWSGHQPDRDAEERARLETYAVLAFGGEEAYAEEEPVWEAEEALMCAQERLLLTLGLEGLDEAEGW